MRITQILVVCLLGTLTTHGDNLNYREWRANNGKSVIAKIRGVRDNQVELRTLNGGEYNVPFHRLDPTEFIYVNQYLRQRGKDEISVPKRNVEDYHRHLIPTTNQSDFGRSGGNSNCGPNACVNFLLWWADLGLIQIEKKETRAQQCEALHTDLGRWMSSGDGTGIGEAKEGLERYFKRNPSPYYSVKYSIEPFTIEAGLEACEGSNLAILSLHVLDKGRPDDGHWVSLVDLKPDGSIWLNTWGRRYQGRVVKGIFNSEEVYYIELLEDPGSEHTEWYREGEGGFMIGYRGQGTLLVAELEDKN